MPGKGPWYEIDTNRHNVISMRILLKGLGFDYRTLRVFGWESDDD